MDKRITESYENHYESCIFPFLWMHGESVERIQEEIEAIKNSGLTEFCVESRPYEEFCKERWWEDFAFILEFAEKLGMRVWLLDDKLFPTGYANGILQKDENAHLRKKLIRERQADLLGPQVNAKIFTDVWLEEGEEIISVIAYKHLDGNEQLDYNSAVDLTAIRQDGCIYWDIPEGVWRICFTIKTFVRDREDRFKYYIDMLNGDSCHALIDAVYEPHYEHFGKYFGNVFRGFFSDEPGFLNIRGTYYNTLGVMHEPYPWRDDLPEIIAEECGVEIEEVNRMLPGLWENIGEKTALIRTYYMETVTLLCRENFTRQIGKWCREHNVMHIGHVIEDLNAHMRLGYGCGHYFRALDGCDMSGIDIVLFQQIPGITQNVHRVPLEDKGYANPEFYNYTLPKLAASHAHLQPWKRGRAMCEIFGAFGWCEGLPFMKQLADNMLVCGINHFVPHAFSPKENDKDCPPHFYNGGKNPQYALFGELMKYMSRTSHILQGGTHIADVAVFYNAEGEWSGGKNQLFQEVCKKLTNELIDFDVIPYDMLEEAEIENGKLVVNNETFGALVVSESEILPLKVLEKFYKMANLGLKIIFTDSLPERSAECMDIYEYKCAFDCVKTVDLGDYIRKYNLNSVSKVYGDAAGLRYYHIIREKSSIYMFYNENVKGNVDARLLLPDTGEYLLYDAWGNKYYKGVADDHQLDLLIEKGNAVIIAFGESIAKDISQCSGCRERKDIDIKFSIYTKDINEEQFSLCEEKSGCIDISSPDRKPYFCGEIIYEAEFECDKNYRILDLGEVGETAQVWLNDIYIGSRINAPYRFDISNSLKDKTNKLKVRVCSNTGHKYRDGFSGYMYAPPTGIIGPISVFE